MEKLVYVLRAETAVAGDVLRARLLNEVAPALLALRADEKISRLRVSVVDDAVARGAALHIGQLAPPPRAFVSFWMEQSQERAAAERVLTQSGAQCAGFLVAESRPLVKTPAQKSGAHAKAPAAAAAGDHAVHHNAVIGARAEGFTLVSCIARRPELSRDEFVRIWYEQQRACAMETQATSQYVRNEIVRAFSPDAPAWDAVVEETFPLAALDDPHAFYDARGDDEKLERHRRRMVETCQKFLDFGAIESHPMSEYDF